MMYFIPRNVVGITGLIGSRQGGILTRKQLVQEYCRLQHLDDRSVWDWSGFYLAFLFFKNSVIVQGVAQRAAIGNASSAQAKQVAKILPAIIQTTQRLLEEYPPPASSRL